MKIAYMTIKPPSTVIDMKKTTDYLNDLCTRYQVDSFQSLGNLLGITRQAINEQIHGRAAMGVYQAVKAAKLLDRPPLEVIAATQAEKAKTEEEKKVWREIYEQEKKI